MTTHTTPARSNFGQEHEDLLCWAEADDIMGATDGPTPLPQFLNESGS
jgi:hypothetical protein